MSDERIHNPAIESRSAFVELPPEAVERAMERAYSVALLGAMRGQDMHEGVARTPARAAKALMEMTSGYDIDVSTLFTTFPGEGYDEMVVERNISFVSLCEHHMLPFEGVAAIAYIPSDRIVGLSKLARVVDAYARRLQVQERLTGQIADAMVDHLSPVGTMVVIEATHSCMSCRGVRKAGVVAVTSAVRGAMKEKPEARAEAMALMRP